MNFTNNALEINDLSSPKNVPGKHLITVSIDKDGVVKYSKEVLIYFHAETVSTPETNDIFVPPVVATKSKSSNLVEPLSEIQSMVEEWRTLYEYKRDEMIKAGTIGSKDHPQARL